MCVINKGVVKKMTVLPGSLDYLYYNGILNHIPYEAYDVGYPVPTMNGSQYLDLAKKGYGYNLPSMPDTFVHQNPHYAGKSEYSIKQNLYDNNKYSVAEHALDK